MNSPSGSCWKTIGLQRKPGPSAAQIPGPAGRAGACSGQLPGRAFAISLRACKEKGHNPIKHAAGKQKNPDSVFLKCFLPSPTLQNKMLPF